MRNLKRISLMLLVTLMINFIPVSASPIWGSKFGIIDAGFYQKQEGGRKVGVIFNDANIENVESVKLYTKVEKYHYNEAGQWASYYVDGASFNLTSRASNEYYADLNESDINEYGKYTIDRIEIKLKDGTNKVSFNSVHYNSLGDNTEENAEILYLFDLSEEKAPLSIENYSFEKTSLKLGEVQSFNFDLKKNRDGIEATKINVTFKKVLDDGSSEQVVVAENVEGTKYRATLQSNDDLDLGMWRISKVEIIDNNGLSIEQEMFGSVYEVVPGYVDINGPVLESITMEKNILDYSIEDEVYFYIKASDDISGIDHIDVELSDGQMIVNKSKTYFEEVDKNIYKVAVNEFSKNGNFTVQCVSLVDKAGNYTAYSPLGTGSYNSGYKYWDFSSFNLEVINYPEVQQADIEILGLTNLSDKINNGTEGCFEVKIKSNKKINNAKLSFSNENWRSTTFNCTEEDGSIISDESEEGVYYLKFTSNDEFHKYLATGNFTADLLSVSYEYGRNKYEEKSIYDNGYRWLQPNSTTYDLSKLDFQCENPNEDITSPKILGISLDKQNVTPGSIVNITVKVSDENSGFRSGEEVRYPEMVYYPFGATWRYVDFYEYDEEENVFRAKLEIPSYMPTGTAIIDRLEIRDIAGNYAGYQWRSASDKEVLSNGTIVVKSKGSELQPPYISSNFHDEVSIYNAPFTPIVSASHGTIKMLLNNKEYNGEPITKAGSYTLDVTATGIDGSSSKAKFIFNVVEKQKTTEEVIEEIKNSPDKIIQLEVKNDNLEVDKSIFEAMKGTDKIISFAQEDGTIWTFEGKDIKAENLAAMGSFKIAVSNIPAEGSKESINSIDSTAKVIHFDYHGVLPGKAKVKVKVDNPQDVIGKELTFYYFNPETQKAEKIQGPLYVDNNGFVTVEIEHCSDYFLSTSDNLHETVEEPQVPEVPKAEVPKTQTPTDEAGAPEVVVENKESEGNNGSTKEVVVESEKSVNTNTSLESNTGETRVQAVRNEVKGKGLPKTGSAVSTTALLISALAAIAVGFKFRKK